MVNVPAIIIGSILVFIILLILIFALTGHLHTNPHIILIIILVGILLFTGYLIAAYYKKWWPYRNILTPSDQNFNNVILYITLIVIVITSFVLAWVIFLAFKHHKENKLRYLIPEKPAIQNEPVPEKLSDIELSPDIEEEQLVQEEEMGQGDVGLEKAEIERLALENQLETEGAHLEKGSNLEIAREIKKLEQKNISEDIIEEGEKLAALKEIEANRALRSTLPSREMFGEGGSEDIINRMGTVPKQLEPEVEEEMELLKSERAKIRTGQRMERIKTKSKQRNEPAKSYQKEREDYEPEEDYGHEDNEPEEDYESIRKPIEAEEVEEGSEEKIKGFESEAGEGEGLFSEVETGLKEAEPELEEGAEMAA